MRRHIDNHHPMIVINTYPMKYASGEDDYQTWWSAMPEDLRPFVTLGCYSVVGDGGAVDKARTRMCHEWCNANRIPFLIPVYNNGRSDWLFEPAEIDGLMAEFPFAIGTWVDEGRFKHVVEGMKTFLPVVKKHGGYFFATQITGWQFMHENMDLYRLGREYCDHLILCIKANGNCMRCRPGAYIDAAEMFQGLWLTGAMGNWGLHPETFLWFEFGYTTLYGPRRNENNRSRQITNDICWDRGKMDDVVQQLGFPENLMAQEILNAAIHGCTVFSGFEHPSMTYQMNGRHTPMFTNCLLPILREVVGRRLIPSKEEVMERTRVAAFHSYAPLYATKCAAVQNIGRYGLIPHLPHYTPADELAKFEKVNEMQATAEDLNLLYPEEGRGSAFIERQGNRWYVWNPHENSPENADFELWLKTCSCPKVTGVLAPHSLMILEEECDGLALYLSNFRTDKAHLFDEHGLPRTRGDLWDTSLNKYGDLGPSPVNRGDPPRPANYLEYCYQQLILSPPRSDLLRSTSIEVHGHGGPGRPRMEIAGETTFTHTQEWDPVQKLYRLVVEHNGVVRARISDLRANPQCGATRQP